RACPWDRAPSHVCWLRVAGYPKDHSNGGVGRTDHELPDDIEVDTELRPEQRQDEEYPDQDYHAVGLHPRQWDRQRTREHAHRDAPAVEGWQREQIEHCE